MPKKSEPTPGQKLRAARLAAKLSQRQVAEAAGVHQSWITQIETGRRPASLDTILQLARAIGVDPHSIDTNLASVSKS